MSVSNDASGATPVSQEVVRRVADARGEDPAALPPLYETLDPDALDALFESLSDSTTELTFSYHGFTVTVTGERSVSLAGSSGGGGR